MCKLVNALKTHIFNFNGGYFTGHQGILIYGCINRSGRDLRKVSSLCMNELCIVLSAAVAILGLACTIKVDFKEVAM